MKNIAISISLLIILMGLSCKKEKEPYAHIQLYLKDTPAQVDSLLIKLHTVELICDSLNYREQVRLNVSKPINILRFTNENDTLLASLDFNSSKITHFTVTFGSYHMLYHKGKSISLNLPDSIITYKISKPIILKNRTNKLYLDFDGYFSLKQLKKDNWIISPVVHLRSADSTGSVRGRIICEGNKPFVWLISLTDTLSTLPNPAGNFHILNVPPGIYSLWTVVNSDDEQYETQMIRSQLIVEANKVTGVGEIRLY